MEMQMCHFPPRSCRQMLINIYSRALSCLFFPNDVLQLSLGKGFTSKTEGNKTEPVQQFPITRLSPLLSLKTSCCCHSHSTLLLLFISLTSCRYNGYCPSAAKQSLNTPPFLPTVFTCTLSFSSLLSLEGLLLKLRIFPHIGMVWSLAFWKSSTEKLS